MTTKNFVVKNGLTTGNIILDASSSNITANFVVANLSVPATANLGAVGNVKITGGTANYVLSTDGTGNLSWVAQTGGGSGSYSNANVAAYLPTYTGIVGGTLSTNAQPNITSLGTLSSLSVSGNLSVGNVITSGTGGNISDANWIIANYFSGNGTGLSSITGGNVVGQVGNSLVAGTVYTAAQPNITSVGTLTSVNVSGNISSGSSVIGTHYGNGYNLSSLLGSNVLGQVANALVAGTVYTAAQPNITSVGTLVSANISGNLLVSGNLTVNGTTEYTNVNNLYIKDPIIEMGGGANGAALTTNDGKDRGTLLHYYTTAPVDAFMGWDSSNAEFAFGSNVSVSSEVVTFNSFGNVRASNFIGTLSGAATTAGTVTTNAQPNITSVGTLSTLTVTGLVTATAGGIKVGNIQDPAGTNTISVSSSSVGIIGNLSVGTGGSGNVTATYFIGNGSTLTGITAGNIVGQVANALVAGTVYVGAQPNITSVGTLASVSVTGNISTAGNVIGTHYGNGYNLSGLLGSNVLGQVGNALVAGTVYVGAQPNITSIGTLTSLNVSGNFTAGNVITSGTGGNISDANWIIANYFSGNGSSLSSITGSNVVGQVGNALVAGTVYTAAQPNITSVGTLTSVSVTGNISSGGNVIGTHYGNGYNLSGILGSNVLGQVGNALVAGTVYTAAQPNITSVGTLASLSVTANVSAGNILTNNLLYANGVAWNFGGGAGSYSNANVAAYLPTYTGNFTAGNANISGALTAGNIVTTGTSGNITGANYIISNYFQGNGSLLTSIAGGNVTGQVGNALVAGTVTTAAQPNITSVGTLTSVSVTGNVSSGGNIIGNGQYLTSISSSNIVGQVANALLAGTVYVGAQPNITSVGTLVDANISGNLLISGNLTVNGTTEYTNVNNLYIKDPIIEMGGGANNTPLTTNDGKDRGTVLHYYTTQPVDAFMGWDNSNGEFAFGSNVTLSSEVATFNSFGNVRAGNFIGTLSGTATTAGTVTTNAQPNITSVGTLSSLTVSSNATVGAAAFGALALDGTNGITTSLSAAEHAASWTISFWMYIPTQTISFPRGLFYTPATNFSFVYGWNGGSNWRLGLTANGMTYCDVDFASPLNQNTWYFVSVSYNGSSVYIGLDGVVTSFSGRTISATGSGLTFGLNTITDSNANSFGPHYLADVSVITGTALYTSNFTKPTTHPSVASGQRLLLLTKTSGTFLYDEVSAANVSYVTASPTYYSGNPIGASGNIISYANITASYFIGNGSQLTSITGANVSGTVANATYSTTTGTVTTAAQPNITSVGTLTTVSVTGNVSSGGNIIGNGQYLTSITGGNVSGQVANALIAGTVYTAAQPNITSVGTLASLSVTANISAGNILTDNLLYANGVAWNFGGGGGGSYSNANVAAYLPTFTGVVGGTLSTNAQPNITSVGSLSSLTVSGLTTATGGVKVGNIQDTAGTNTISVSSSSVGIIGNLTVGTGGTGNVSATYFIGNGSQLTGLPASYSNANVAAYLPTYSGNFTAGNVDFTSASNVTLGSVANLHISGGTANYVLSTDGAGTLNWVAQSGGGGGGITYTAAATPPGSANIADQWFNTTANILYEYINDGSASYWVDITTPSLATPEVNQSFSVGTYKTRNYTGDGSTASFSITTGLTANSILAIQDGVIQAAPADYTVSGSTVTFTTIPFNGAKIQIRELGYAVPTVPTTAQLTPALRAQSMVMSILFGG